MNLPAGRRLFLRCLGGLACLVPLVVASACSPTTGSVVARRPPPEPADWDAFKGAFLRPEGRITDDRDGAGASRSADQGFGMVLAEAYADRAGFDRLWDWTRANLQTRPADQLLSRHWRPDPTDPGRGAVDDPNNATEGDLLVAWALARAGVRWRDAAYTDAARALSRDVRTRLIRPSPFGPVLLPGIAGFERPPASPPDGRSAGTLVLDPACWVFPAFPELYRLDPDAAWPGLQQSGSALLRGARFGPGQLPADRVETPAGTPVLAADKRMGARPAGDPPVFGQDAMRVSLYLLWSGRDPNDELLAPFNHFWGRFESPERVPAAVNVETGRRAGPENVSPGAALLGRWVLGLPEGPPGQPRVVPNLNDGCRSSALVLLTRVGRAEAGRQ